MTQGGGARDRPPRAAPRKVSLSAKPRPRGSSGSVPPVTVATPWSRRTGGAEVSIAQGMSAVPRLVASIAVMLSGRGGTPVARAETNASSARTSIGLNRRSKPIVVLGRPHIPLPQGPSKWPGNTATQSGRPSSRRTLRNCAAGSPPPKSGPPTSPTKSESPVSTMAMAGSTMAASCDWREATR